MQAAKLNWRIKEYPVPLIYLDEDRSFGGSLDDGQTRLDYYNLVVDRSLAAFSTDRPLCETVDKNLE